MIDNNNLTPPIISLNPDKCVNCHACIAACPVKACNDGSDDHVEIDDERCIGCGQCLTACSHQARSAVDELPDFLHALEAGERIVAIVAPSVASNFPNAYLQLNSWLKSVGAEAVFDVSFGAELAAKSYAAYLDAPVASPVIASACPAIVHYVRMHHPELVPNLAPLSSPMQHTLEMIRESRDDLSDCAFALISPCPAKKREFAAMDVKSYGVTFRGLEQHFSASNIRLDEFAPSDYDGPAAASASCLPTPGGLLQAIERWRPGAAEKTRRIEGASSVYAYLKSIPRTLEESPDSLPVLIDCLNCEHGCNIGPASIKEIGALDIVETAIRRRGAEAVADDDQPIPESVREAIEAHWHPGRFGRRFDRTVGATWNEKPNAEQLDAIYRSMHKYSEADLFNCCSCGYGSCELMAVAIHNGLNRPENCHHYIMHERTLAHEQIARHQEHLEATVEKRTVALSEANSLLQTEVTERKRVENALLDSEEKLKCILCGSPVAKFVIGRDHRVLHWNHAIEELTGTHANAMLGTRDHWRPFYSEPRPCLIDLLLDGEHDKIDLHYPGRWLKFPSLPETHEFTDFFPNLGEEGKWLTFRGVVIKDSKGEVVGALETLEDITEQRRTQEALAKSREAAEAANAAKSRFLANMSHEIRTPLNGIIGFSELILDSCESEQVRDQSRMILRESEHLLALINEVLDHSKIEAGRLLLENRPVHIRRLLESITAGMRPQAEKKGLKLIVSVGESVPESVLGDPTRMRQILMNLVGNAIKFTETGSVSVNVRSRGIRKNVASLLFEVADTGVGIPKEKQAAIFDGFHQVDASTTRKYGGTGLGTTISRRLVELMGGKIDIESAPGVGTCFWFTLDLEVSEDQWRDQACEDGPGSADRGNALTGRVLIVDDYTANQFLARAHLEDCGCEVDLADNGIEGITACENAHYDLVLMDLQMPEMDGYEAVTRIREGASANRAVPIVAMTADASPQTRERCLALGINEVITKPIRRRPFLASVAQWLGPPENSSNDARPVASEGGESGIPPRRHDAPLDYAYLINEFAGDEETVDLALRQFIEDLSPWTRQLHHAVADRDADTTARIAHTIKGAAGMLMAHALAEAAKRLEQFAREEAWGEVSRRLSAFEKEVLRLEAFTPAEHS